MIGFRCVFGEDFAGGDWNMGGCKVYDDLPVTWYKIYQTFVGWTMYLGESKGATFQSTELTCYNEQFSYVCKKLLPAPAGLTVMPCPTGMTVDTTDVLKLYNIAPTTYTDVGTWTITMTGMITVPVLDPISGAPN